MVGATGFEPATSEAALAASIPARWGSGTVFRHRSSSGALPPPDTIDATPDGLALRVFPRGGKAAARSPEQPASPVEMLLDALRITVVPVVEKPPDTPKITFDTLNFALAARIASSPRASTVLRTGSWCASPRG
jgi:hypothetical protein